MPGDFIAIKKENLGASRINTVRGSNVRQATQAGSTMSAQGTRNWYVSNASMPNDNAGTNEIKWSEFRSASVVTGRAVGDPESVTTYADAKDGEVEVYLCCQSVVTDGNDRKNYGYVIGTSSITKSELVSAPNVSARSHSICCVAHGTYPVQAYDALSRSASTISANVVVGYGGSKSTYENLQ